MGELRDTRAVAEADVQQEQEQEVNLVPQSTRNYLLYRKRDSNAVLERFRLEAQSAHLKLAQECVDCIAQSVLRHWAIDLNAELDP